MGERTGIPWCHHTFNPWWGCVEVSPACDHCYARTWATRVDQAVWGKDAPRRFFGPDHWAEPLRWDRRAREVGERRRVFCASMADVFEERSDAIGRQLDVERSRLWALIAGTPSLDWLLLTKRPAGMRRLLPPKIAALTNVWPGVTVESQDYVWRLDELLQVACVGPRWVSAEPLLGRLELEPWLGHRGIRWVVAGGESGGQARPCDLAWLRDLRDQCRESEAAYFCKQFGARPVIEAAQGSGPDVLRRQREIDLEWPDGTHFGNPTSDPALNGRVVLLRDRKGGDPQEWPSDLRVRDFPCP